MSSNYKSVWSDDPKDKKKDEEAKNEALKSPNWVAVFRLEKNNRGGKTVTVIDMLPKQEIFLRDLCKELKTKCGSGGTYSTAGREGVIEIQGDKRDVIKAIFDKKGYRYKGM